MNHQEQEQEPIVNPEEGTAREAAEAEIPVPAPDEAGAQTSPPKGPIVMILSLVALAAIVFLLFQFAFTLSNVVVIGSDSETDTQRIITASGLAKGQNMLLIREEDVAARIKKEHELIYVGMQKDFASRTVYLQVQKRISVACIDNFGVYYLLDINGMVMGKCDKETASLYPAITGIQNSNIRVGTILSGITQAQFQAYQTIMESILPTDCITKINLSDTDNLEAETSENLFLQFGDASNMSAKLRSYRIIRARFKQQGTSGTLYLSNPEQVIMQPDSPVDYE